MHSTTFYTPDTPQPMDGDTTFGFPMASQVPFQTQAQQMTNQQVGEQQVTGQQAGTQQAPSQQQPQPSTSGAAPVAFEDMASTPVFDIQYTQGYLSTQIGARVKVEFLIGTNMLIDREGTLIDVGISYIIIREVDTDDLLLCDIYSIKFVRFYY